MVTTDKGVEMKRVCDPAMIGPRDTECICEAYDDGNPEDV